MKLQKRLTTSYLIIALIATLLAGTAGAFVLRVQQERTARTTLQSMARQAAVVLRNAPNRSLAARELRALAEQHGLRLLVINREGQVVADTGDTLEGASLGDPASIAAALRTDSVFSYRGNGEDLLLAPIPIGGNEASNVVLLAVPRSSLLNSWIELLPGLLGAMAVAVLVSWAVGWYFSRRITEPLGKITEAAKRIAAGDFSARAEVDTSGDDEIAQLARAFNTMIDEVNVARDTQRDFLANVSHDLRTPLTSIQGFSEALMDGTVPPAQQQRVAAIIHEEASRLSRLVQDLLDLARIESGRFIMARRDVDLNEIIRHLKDIYASRAEAEGIKFKVRHPRKALPIVGDPDRLEQVLTNLLDNAFKYAQQSPDAPEVRLIGKLGGVRGVTQDGAGGDLGRWWIEIQVMDNGPGIAAQDLPHIFDRFYRADQARSGGGVGLGLAIAREIVQAHGGEIAVESGDKGTTFTVRLPMNMGHQSTQESAQHASA
ncbi:MAG: sensor histidine kinase [Ardenticatenia bacterium]|nr:MAG: sensor histidine kinase [Ardenticatenia bacterium]